MGLKVYWTSFSKNELQNIFNYYKENTNKVLAKNIVEGLVKRAEVLSNFPEIGPIEILLDNRIENFRNLVHKKYLLV